VERFDPSRGYGFPPVPPGGQGPHHPPTPHDGDQLHPLRRSQQSLSQELGRNPNLEELEAATELKSLVFREVLFMAQEPLTLDGQ
jgi:DNA-directed RNA polymerase sigma subunit (sigma70/sigma32)